LDIHIPHPHIKHRAISGPHTTEKEHVGFNGRVALLITGAVGTMWCAYIFAVLALVSLPDAIKGGTAQLIAWIAQTFLQLVLLSVIMVGQKVAAAASDKQALQTYNDAEALLKIQDELHQLLKLNNDLTTEIHTMIAKQNGGAAPAEVAAT
jgi:ABC-type nickel/cobalt efflux system permease component RcnA